MYVKNFENIEELVTYIEQQSLSSLFIKTENCGVCDVMLEKVSILLDQYNDVKQVVIFLEDMKEVSAKYLVFTAPTIILFKDGKEVMRESRFISLGKIERMLQLV